MQTSLYDKFMAVGSVKSLLTGQVYTSDARQTPSEKERTESEKTSSQTNKKESLILR